MRYSIVQYSDDPTRPISSLHVKHDAIAVENDRDFYCRWIFSLSHIAVHPVYFHIEILIRIPPFLMDVVPGIQRRIVNIVPGV